MAKMKPLKKTKAPATSKAKAPAGKASMKSAKGKGY